MPSLPTGTVTFLFTDIEASTRLWEEHPDQMKVALARHDRLLRSAIESHHGYVFSTAGDAFSAAFNRAQDAVAAALATQWAMVEEDWGDLHIAVRVALHTGEADERDGDYFGSTVNRAARLLSVGHAGQVLMSRATREVVRQHLPTEADLVDLGEHRLPDIARPAHVFQLVHPDLPNEFPPLVTAVVVPSNLPVQVTSFVGRDQETAEVKKLVARSRLVTLSGAGGSGKTRLALAVVSDLLDEFSNGVWFVDLSPLTDGMLVSEAVASALGVRERQGQPTEQVLVDNLRDTSALVLLDNCEHLISEVAKLASYLLHRTEKLRLLATSRQPLHIQGESVYVVPTMTTPTDDVLDRSELARFPAVRLLTERAELAAPSFRMTDDNAAQLGQLCRRLDGLPLALELAAARLSLFQPLELLERLEDRFRVLVGGHRDRPERQQTLEATLDWSYQLLSDDEQEVLNRLSVFAAGCSLAAAEHVCADDGMDATRVSDLVYDLASKSLLTVEPRPEGSRISMLDTVQEYAARKLAKSGASRTVRDRHANYFGRMAEDSYQTIRGPEEAQVEATLEENHANLRAALAWQFESGSPDDGVAMAGALSRFWGTRHYYSEAQHWLQRFLEADTPASLARARALRAAAQFLAPSPSERDALLEESLELYRQLDAGSELNALDILAGHAHRRGDWQEAEAWMRQLLSLARSAEDTVLAAHTAGRLAELIANTHGPISEALALSDESVDQARSSGSDQMLALCLSLQSNVRLAGGDLDGAAQAATEAIRIEARIPGMFAFTGAGLINSALAELDRGHEQAASEQIRAAVQQIAEASEDADVPGTAAWCLNIMGFVESARGNSLRAATILGAAAERRRRDERNVFPVFLERYERSRERAREALDPKAFAAAWEKGSSMTLEEIIAYALDQSEG